MCYKDEGPVSCRGTGGYNAPPYVAQVWAYNADDLVKVKTGQLQPWQVLPYAVWHLNLPFGSTEVGGVAYDSATQRLFVTQRFGDGEKSVIHVYKVNSGTTTSDTTPPNAPTGLSISAVSTGQINLSWTASSDNVAVTGYAVERCQDSSCTNFIQIASPTGTLYNNTGLAANTTYRFRVRASDAAGNFSGYSSIVSATTQAVPPPPLDTTAPSIPSSLSPGVVSASVKSVSLGL